MRWLFLLLVVLNVFYYVWHQQEAPLKAKYVIPLTLYKGAQQDIRLLSESRAGARRPDGKSGLVGALSQGCMYLGGVSQESQLGPVESRLLALGVQVQPACFDGADK